MEHKDFEFEVPEGYRQVYHIDAADKKTGLKLTLGAMAIMIVVVAVLFVFADLKSLDFGKLIEYDLAFIGIALVYIVVHELTHLKAANHGPRFYALMDARLPGWKELRRRLNRRDFANRGAADAPRPDFAADVPRGRIVQGEFDFGGGM